MDSINPEGAWPKGRQMMEETSLEKEFRAMGKYPEIEADMPVLRSRRGSGLVDRVSAILGERNPLGKPVDPHEHLIWLLDHTAYRTDASNEWATEVSAAYFVKDTGIDSSKTVAKISELIGLAEDDEARKRVAERLRPFLEAILPAHYATYELNNKTYRLGPSSTDGFTNTTINFDAAGNMVAGAQLTPSLVGIASQVPTSLYTADKHGWAVISDIDDTIKKTLTSSALGVLQTTFVDDPEPIAGMPELYQHIASTFGQPSFWYLSASPYNLYDFLRQFRDTFKYPAGQLMLRDASWMSLAGLLASITQGTQAYKVSRMQKLQRWFPHRSFIAVGDSTQTDPEAYAEMYTKHPGWIRAIFIRRVRNVEMIGKVDEEAKIKPERFERAFARVRPEDWYVFDEPQELYDKLAELKSRTPDVL